jgi:hypothetical protein
MLTGLAREPVTHFESALGHPQPELRHDVPKISSVSQEAPHQALDRRIGLVDAVCGGERRTAGNDLGLFCTIRFLLPIIS